MNTIGIGAFFNVLNFGQMYGFHIVILPAILSALARARVRDHAVGLPRGNYGPVAPMMAGLLNLGRAGLLEPAIDHSPRIYTTDNTRSLLFLQARPWWVL